MWRHGAHCWRVAAAATNAKCKDAAREPPLLIVHGVLASARQYLPLARALARHHRAVWVVDLPGFGVTPALPESGVDACIDFVARFVARLSHDHPLTVVAHSFGAFLVQAALNKHPGVLRNLDHVVLASVGCLYPTLHLGTRDRWRTLWWAPFFRYRLLGGALRALARAWPALGAGVMRYTDLETCAHSVEGENMLSECLAVHANLEHRWTRPCAAGVASLARAVPVTLLWGAEDALFSYSQARKFAADHGVRLAAAPGVGHSVLLHPRAAAWIRRLLRRPEGDAHAATSSFPAEAEASSSALLLSISSPARAPPKMWLTSSTISEDARLHPA